MKKKIRRNQKKGVWMERKGGKMRERKKWGRPLAVCRRAEEKGSKKKNLSSHLEWEANKK